MEELFYDWGVLADDMMIEDIGPDFRSQGGDLIIRRFAKHPITKLLFPFVFFLRGLPQRQLHAGLARSWRRGGPEDEGAHCGLEGGRGAEAVRQGLAAFPAAAPPPPRGSPKTAPCAIPLTPAGR